MKTMIFSLLALFSLGAHAASDQAWAAHDKAMTRACLAASQFKDAKPASKPAEFDDRVGYSALLLTGHYPQKHMKNQKGSELCLFDKQRNVAFVTEWTPVKP